VVSICAASDDETLADVNKDIEEQYTLSEQLGYCFIGVLAALYLLLQKLVIL